MKASSASRRTSANEADNTLDPAYQDCTLQNVPVWSHDELFMLMDSFDNKESSFARISMLRSTFKNREASFFTNKTCNEKYDRLTGKSGHMIADDKMHAWIKEFLQKPFIERFDTGIAGKMTKVSRFHELLTYASSGKLTFDQIVELLGPDLFNDFITNGLTKKERADHHEWLHAGLIVSKMSQNEWNKPKSCFDRIEDLRAHAVNECKEQIVEFESLINDVPASPYQAPDSIDIKQELVTPKRIVTPKRRSRIPDSAPQPTVSLEDINQKRLLLSLHESVMGHPMADPFLEPVTEAIAPGYTKFIQRPMDLRTIKRLIEEDKIKTLAELSDHYLLMCTNALIYNEPYHHVYKAAVGLRRFCSDIIRHMNRPVARKSANRRLAGGTPFHTGSIKPEPELFEPMFALTESFNPTKRLRSATRKQDPY